MVWVSLKGSTSYPCHLTRKGRCFIYLKSHWVGWRLDREEDRAMSRKSLYPQELRERAVRMVREVRSQYDTEFAAIRAVAEKLGIGTAETLRKWVRESDVEEGRRPGVSREESAELKQLRRENAELRRANEILKAASAYFARELDPKLPR